MTDNANSPPCQEPAENGWLADLIRRVSEIYAKREAADPTPAPAHPPEPQFDKPGTLIAAEKDVFRWEMVEKLQEHLCGGAVRCKHHRCRRRKRCRVLEEMAPAMAASRANLAAERAKWHPPVSQADPPRGRKKGRTGVRP